MVGQKDVYKERKEYRNVRIDHGKVIQAEAEQYGNRKGEGETVIGGRRRQ